MKILIVCAHPDDETGCLGFLARMSAERTRKGSGLPLHKIRMLFLGTGVGSRGEKGNDASRATIERHIESGNALETIGITDRSWWGDGGPEDNCFDARPLLEITRKVEREVRRHRPDVIYTHQPNDLNIDHRIVCQAVLTATRPVPGQTVKAVYGMEVPSSTEWAFGAPPFTPNVFQPLTDAQMEKKRAALRCYASEMRSFPHPRSIEAIDALARWRGSQCGHPWAEAFQLLREVR